MSAPGMFTMKSVKKAAIVLSAIAGLSGLSARAETVLSVTQTSFDVRNQPICTVVRMNPAIYGSLPSDACALGTAGSYGPDRITKNTYDLASQLTQVEQAVGTTDARIYARYTYSNNGLKTSEKDANGNLTTLEYDGFDRLSKLRYPNTTSGAGTSSTTDYETYGYDAGNNRTSWRRRDGQVINYTYDNLSREIIKDIPGGTAKDIYTGYDLTGKIIYKRFGSTSGSGVSYSYNSLGWMSSTTDMNGRTIWPGYNQAAARVQLIHADGQIAYFGRDNRNRLTGASFTGYGGLYGQSYDDLGRRNALWRTVGSTSYTYDAVGRLASMTNDLNGSPHDITWTFAYNPASQIASFGASSTVYDYKETANTTVNKTFDGLNRDATIAALSGGFDTRGNLTYDGTRTFTYDVENRLLTATGGGANLVFIYDPEGRLARFSTDGGSSYNDYLYDGVNLIGEYNSAGLMRRYIHGAGTDEPIAWFEGSGMSDLRFYYQNYQGSVIGYTDASGNLLDFYKYGPYGEPRGPLDTENWAGSRFKYTGQTMIPEAKLYYYKARVYDPVFGRFLQTDPVGSKSDLDLYAYTRGDPINNTDPTGLDSFKIYDATQAGGFGHAMAVYVDKKGNVSGYEFTGKGELNPIKEMSGMKVGVDKNGDVTKAGASSLMSAANSHWTNLGGKPQVSAIQFTSADSKSGFMSAVNSVQSQINKSGGPAVSFLISFNGNYGLLNNNCVLIADKLVAAAGARTGDTGIGGDPLNPNFTQPRQGYSSDIIPNEARRQEQMMGNPYYTQSGN